MSTIKSQQQLYDEFITELQNQAPSLTDTHDGSQIDVIAGVVSFALSEISRLTIDEFRKTFFDTANGPEVTGGPDDLETLAVDHFGSNFTRPAASSSTGVVTFSRPDSDDGDCIIPAGTVVKTQPNADGEAQRFETETEVTMTGLSINATVNAIVPGTDGNVADDTVVVIEDALTDSSIEVTNGLSFIGGAEEETDVQYRETIRNRLVALTGATLGAIEGAALEVAGIETATAIENEMVVIEYDIATSSPVDGVGYFRIPNVILYIADANGTADAELIAAVKAAIAPVRAAGVRVDVQAATALVFNWTGSIVLNPAGPNYAELSIDAQAIIDSMIDYLADMAIGDDFIRTTANAAIFAIWGPSGTDDLVSFTTSTPSGDVAVDNAEKIIPGTVGLG